MKLSLKSWILNRMTFNKNWQQLFIKLSTSLGRAPTYCIHHAKKSNKNTIISRQFLWYFFICYHRLCLHAQYLAVTVACIIFNILVCEIIFIAYSRTSMKYCIGQLLAIKMQLHSGLSKQRVKQGLTCMSRKPWYVMIREYCCICKHSH